MFQIERAWLSQSSPRQAQRGTMKYVSSVRMETAFRPVQQETFNRLRTAGTGPVRIFEAVRNYKG